MNARDERGSVLVESPFCIAILLFLAFGFVTLAQLMWTHVDLSSAVRSATRYAARAEYDPSATPATSSRRPGATSVESWTAEVASEAGVSPSDVTITRPDGSAVDPTALVAGDQIVVTITHKVSNPLYQLAASTTDALAGFFHAGNPFDPTGMTVKAEATTYVE